MDNIIRQLQNHGNEKKIHADVCAGLTYFVQDLTSMKCLICSGIGHTAKTCSTKKTIDAACRNNKPWRIVWGECKGIAKRKATQKNVDKVYHTLQANQKKLATTSGIKSKQARFDLGVDPNAPTSSPQRPQHLFEDPREADDDMLEENEEWREFEILVDHVDEDGLIFKDK